MHLDKDVVKYKGVNNKQYVKLCSTIEPIISTQLLIKKLKTTINIPNSLCYHSSKTGFYDYLNRNKKQQLSLVGGFSHDYVHPHTLHH